MKDMMQEYNNDKISEDTTANDVGLTTYNPTTVNDVGLTTDNSDNNGELTTNNSANDDGYNLRRNKRNYGKHIGKVDTANDFAFLQGISRKIKTQYSQNYISAYRFSTTSI